ncbi:MAG: transglutaminase family protein [Bacteroidota bacterium]
MILSIKHRTFYEYADPVFLEPHHLYFTPSTRWYFDMLSFSLQVKPLPTGISSRIDLENNSYYQSWFEEKISDLEIQTQIRLSVESYNPFHFLTEMSLPPSTSLHPAYSRSVELSEGMVLWAKKLRAAKDSTLDYALQLNQVIQNDWKYVSRETPGVLPPSECFQTKSGSCRDLSWMMIQLLRANSIPSRFVSGYALNSKEKKGYDLHAWVEFLVPGAGWIACDPTSGLLCDEQYIPLCASYHYENTMPVQGTYRGNSTSKLKHTIQIDIEK